MTNCQRIFPEVNGVQGEKRAGLNASRVEQMVSGKHTLHPFCDLRQVPIARKVGARSTRLALGPQRLSLYPVGQSVAGSGERTRGNAHGT